MEIMETTALIVDDEIAACQMLQKYLTMEGFKATSAHNGEEAVQYALENRPDVIILDIRMPRMSGDEALAQIRKFDGDAVITMLTAVEDIEMGVATLKGGADDFLRKPVILQELLHSIRSSMEKHALIRENREYQKNLEFRVAEQTTLLTRLNADLKQANKDMILAFSEAIEAKDTYTKGHCRRVAAYSRKMGKFIGLGKNELETLECGALLHDVGKIGISENILNKPGKLTDEEFESMKAHAIIGYNIISNIHMLRDANRIIRHHHERYDGAGYPDNIESDKIDILARIVAIADAYDAMTSERPYRKSIPKEKALSTLRDFSGTQFDPRLVAQFLREKLYLIVD
jgi:response regulator RpfG family c-di-GMP phosphodiesterase